jgi:hypothetical protein
LTSTPLAVDGAERVADRAQQERDPIAAMPRPFAPRCDEEIWAVTAATAAKVIPTPAIAAPAASDPTTGRSKATNATAAAVPSSRFAASGDDERGGQRRVAADHGGADELGSARLLVRAGVAHDRLDAHDADEHGENP